MTERYIQPVLVEPSLPSSEPLQLAKERLDVYSIAADPEGLPHGLASHRKPNDFWQEFHLEWAFREANGMAPVSPAEFADMRDFADRITVYLDIDQPEPPYERRKRP